MNLVGLEGEDRKTYTFNAKNTCITKNAARNLSNAARIRIMTNKGKGKALASDRNDDNDGNLREAFTLLPHQIAEAKIINDYRTGCNSVTCWRPRPQGGTDGRCLRGSGCQGVTRD